MITVAATSRTIRVAGGDPLLNIHMAILKLEQHPADILVWTWDFSRFLAPDDSVASDTIVSATAVAQPVSLTVGAVSIVNDSTAVSVMLGPGIDQQVYDVTVTIVTAGGLAANSQRTFSLCQDAR